MPERCKATNAHAEGPFYRPDAPFRLKLYPDGATGPILYFSANVTDVDCRPLSGVKVEIWQADDMGHYDNDDPESPPPPDFFRCRGHAFTDETGRVDIRTVLPANYEVEAVPGWIRVKHLHFKLFQSGFEPLTTEVALVPDEYSGSDQLFNPSLAAELIAAEPDPASGRNILQSSFRFTLERVSRAGYQKALASFAATRAGPL